MKLQHHTYSPGSSLDLAPVHRSTPPSSPSVPRTSFIRGATVAQVHHLSPDVADPDDPEYAASTVSRSPVSSSLGAADVQPDQLITFQADISMLSGVYIIEFMYILKMCLNLYILLNLCIF